MPVFRFEIIDSLGEKQQGELSAESIEVARQELMAYAREVIELSPVKSDQANGQFSQGVSSQVTEQIAELAASQLPLEEGLKRMASEYETAHWSGASKTGDALRRLAAKLEAGVSLPEAFEQFGAPADLTAVIRSGMRSGDAGGSLIGYTAHVRDMAALRSQVRMALVYPFILVCFSVSVLIVLAIVTSSIVQEYRLMFEGFGIELPYVTRSLIIFSNIVETFLTPILGFLGVIASFLVILKKVLPKSVIRAVENQIPVFGPILKSMYLSRFLYGFAYLIEHQVPLSEAIRLSGESSGDSLLKKQTFEWARRIDNGESATLSAQQVRGIPPELTIPLRMTTSPESVVKSIRALGTLYEKRARKNIDLILVFAEPAVVIVSGFTAGWVVIGLFYPLIMLMNDLS